MSAVVQAVAVATSTPLPSPQVIKETFTVPAQIPAVVVQATQIAGMFFAAFLLSVIHRLVEWFTAKEKGWNSQLNVVLATLYSVGVGLVGTATMHQLGTDATQLVTLAVSSFTAFSGSFWTHALRKATAGLLSNGVTATSTVEPLATEQDPVQGVG